MNPRGPKPTTLRGRRAGARELRAWLSAEEHARWVAAAEARGMTVGDYVRAMTPQEEKTACATMRVADAMTSSG